MAIIKLSNKSRSLLIEIIEALSPHKEELALDWKKRADGHKLYSSEMSLDYYERTMERYLFSLSDGDFDAFYERIGVSAVEFAREGVEYDTFVLSFHLFEEATMEYLNRLFEGRVIEVIEVLDHLYHNTMSILAKCFFQELEKEREMFYNLIAHDMKQPLNRINLCCEILAGPMANEFSEKGKNVTQSLVTDITIIVDMIEDVLQYGNIRSGKLAVSKVTVNLAEIVQESCGKFHLQCSESEVNLIYEGVEEVFVEGDKKLLERAVNNYLSNAIKYANKDICCNLSKKGDEVVFSVSDDGRGISGKYMNNLFTDYFRVPGSKEGTGLGLYGVKTIIELHGGKVGVESEEEKGSRFYFVIPVKQLSSLKSEG